MAGSTIGRRRRGCRSISDGFDTLRAQSTTCLLGSSCNTDGGSQWKLAVAASPRARRLFCAYRRLGAAPAWRPSRSLVPLLTKAASLGQCGGGGDGGRSGDVGGGGREGGSDWRRRDDGGAAAAAGWCSGRWEPTRRYRAWAEREEGLPMVGVAVIVGHQRLVTSLVGEVGDSRRGGGGAAQCRPPHSAVASAGNLTLTRGGQRRLVISVSPLGNFLAVFSTIIFRGFRAAWRLCPPRAPLSPTALCPPPPTPSRV